MESLPPELHALILDVGCGSYPGAYIPRTLSLTSTYFRDVAAPFLFHTVAISCEKQATQLLALLETAPAHQRRIRRLFLGPALTSSTVLLLLYFAAPTLRDLAVTAAPALLGALFRTHLPHLRALSVRGFYPLPRPGAFPALTHLHLAGNPSPSGLPAALARAYPALTHLRISGLRGAPAFARELRAVLEEDERLEHVVLEAQAYAVNQRKENKVAQVRDAEMREIFSALSSAGKDERGPRVGFIEGVDVDEEKMKLAWLDMACP